MTPKSHLTKEVARSLLLHLQENTALHPGLLMRANRLEAVRQFGADERKAIWAARYYLTGQHRMVGNARSPQ